MFPWRLGNKRVNVNHKAVKLLMPLLRSYVVFALHETKLQTIRTSRSSYSLPFSPCPQNLVALSKFAATAKHRLLILFNHWIPEARTLCLRDYTSTYLNLVQSHPQSCH